MPHQPAP
jgi:hypothetical protein